MAQPIERRWTKGEFFAWQERQSERFELVDGFPRLMAGASNGHDDIVVNLLSLLREKLRGTGCRPFTGDGSVETFPGQIRRPDVGVDCGRRNSRGYSAAEPRLVVEVLSPSTRDFDTFGKLDEYKAVDSIGHILIVEPNAPEAVLWSRGAERRWEQNRIEGLDAAVELSDLGVSLAMADVYDGIEFPPGLRSIHG